MEIGDRVALHKNLFPNDPGGIEDEFTIAIISEVRHDVPGMFGKDKFDGYRAKDNVGRTFELHWDSFPDDAAEPGWLWKEVDPTRQFEDGSYKIICSWADMTRGSNFNIPRLPHYFKDAGILGYCEKHKELFYLEPSMGDGECFHCYLMRRYGGEDTRAKAIAEMQTFKGW